MPSGRYLIAMCDVLGFTSLVAATPLDEIYERYMALRAELGPNPLFRIKPGTYEREIILNRVVFSDTILWWAPEGETAEILPYVIGQIMALGFRHVRHRSGQRDLYGTADHRRLSHRAGAGMDGWRVSSILLDLARLPRSALQGIREERREIPSAGQERDAAAGVRPELARAGGSRLLSRYPDGCGGQCSATR